MSIYLAAIWSLGLLAIYLLLHRARFRPQRTPRYAGAIILTLALLVRLVPNVLVPAGDNYDMQSYQIVGSLVDNGQEVYRATAGENRYPYLPFLLYWMGIAVRLSDLSGLPFAFVIRLLPILADALIAFSIYWILAKKTSVLTGYFAGILYVFNPVTVFISAYQGQFDPLAALFVILAGVSLAAKPLLSGITLGAGILVKSWPVLTYPSLIANLVSWRKKLIFTAGMLAVPFLGILIYNLLFKANPIEVLLRALSYDRGAGIWGYTYLVRLVVQEGLQKHNLYSGYLSFARYITLLFLFLVWWFKARFEDSYASILTMLLGFFVLTHAFAIQYLKWLVPFGLLTGAYTWTRRYTMAAFAYMFLVYFTLILSFKIGNLIPWPAADLWIIIPFGLPAWLVCIGWLVTRFRMPAEQVEPEPRGV
jgi:hypothetical protein